jgi:hypothetical protein
MVAIMVSAMVVMAAFLFWRMRPEQVAESDAARPPRGQEKVATPADAPLKIDPPADAPQTGKAAESKDSAAAGTDSPTVKPSALPAEETKSANPPKAAGKDADQPGKEDDAKPADPVPEKSAKQTPSMTPQQAPADRELNEKYQRAVAELRAAMGQRDLVGAKLKVKGVAALAQTPEQEAEVARLDVLIGHLREFWRVMAETTARFQPSQEITVGDTPVIVVEGGPSQVTLRTGRKSQTFQVKALPRPIVDGIVEACFADNPANKVLHGAFLAFDPKGDRQRARKLWQQAIDGGQKIDNLLAELDAAPPAAGVKTGGAQDPNAKADVPTDPDVLEKADRDVQAQFEADYKLAATAAGKLKLVETLVKAAAGADLSAESRFVMLRDARDHAVAAGKPELACEVIDRLGQFFTVDALEMKVAAVEQVAKSARTSKSGKEVAECALGLVEHASQLRRLDAAARLADVSVSAAQRAKNATLLRDAQEAKQKVETMSEKGAGGGKKKRDPNE